MPSIRRSYTNTKNTKKEPSGRVNKYWGLYVGVVKENRDLQRMGRLEVWIAEFGSQENDSTSWRAITYCSPFAGATPISNIGKDLNKFEDTQTSYGMWFPPPDIGAQVIVFFINGDPVRGCYLGGIYDQYMNHMVPGVASSENYRPPAPGFPQGKSVPVAEYNKTTVQKVINDISRPVATPHYEGTAKQGLINDPIRGTTTSSARREAPSQVYGISTPGPRINENDPNNLHRLGGHSFVMDDGTGTEHITLRTRSGSKIRIDETNGMIYFINKTGTGWMQLDEEGNVDIFAAKDMSFRSEQDVNIRADRNINIEAGQNIYMKAAKDTDADLNIVGEDNGVGGDIYIQALNNEQHTVKQDMFVTVTDGNLNIDVQTGTKTEHVAGDVNETFDSNTITNVGNNVDVKAGGYIHTEAGADYTFAGTNATLSTPGTLHVNQNILSVGQGWFGSVLTGGLSIGGPPPPPVGGSFTAFAVSGGDGVIEGSLTVDGDILMTGGSLQLDAGSIYAQGDISSSAASLSSLANHTHTYTVPQHGAGPGNTGPTGTPTGPPGLSPQPPEPSEPIVPPEPPEDSAPATPAMVKPTVEKTNILEDFEDQYMFDRKTQQVLTTVGRFITYEPCPEHKE